MYEDTRKAVLPQVHFILGPPKSGKKSLGQGLAERTNMASILYDDFIRERNLHGKDDETTVNALIKYLVN